MTRNPAVTTGYYRFTDIFFEWHKALPNPADISPLKALIAHNALVHPDHPLHKPGVKGIELFHGTFENGEMRLLFSSAQVEYLRYWLQAMKLTEKPIPIPSSEYLIQRSDLTNVSPNMYEDGAELKRAIKNLDKNNKRLQRGGNTMMVARRLAFERSRTLWTLKAGTWLAIDFEAWDRDHTAITEFGYSLVRWENEEQVREDGHLIVQENRTLRQTYVAQHTDKYSFGDSEVLTRRVFKQRIGDLIERHHKQGPVFLVFHDPAQDIKYLMSEDIEAIRHLDYVLPDAPQNDIYVVDTAELFGALEGEESNNMRSLETICRHLRIETKFLHNAGNDAHYTLDALISMASGDPLDDQREKRWPRRTGDYDTKVQREPWEDDPDYSDTEGVVRGALGDPDSPGAIYDEF